MFEVSVRMFGVRVLEVRVFGVIVRMWCWRLECLE